ncbi:fibronectin-binding protein [Mycolicibacterium duvalii]|uniref:Fibronectin-binding protein n=1 Tax=Mycolicibacterium duvalii TaxID=39688 RepID=A0A7I7K419_9MYCO|nr:fibronectin-binding protein [Mycolicibacterium duvalii]MCV7367156.1 fibronectin-binding protein [Mycolicibacterium duvalii]BBX18288.1 hypothetical protein MDUV_31480 [Mycolicibacterium duvalii]
MKLRAAIVAMGLAPAALGIAAPAAADPAADPCQLAVTFLCRFVPMAADLDHNIDLTQETGVNNGQPVPQLPIGE